MWRCGRVSNLVFLALGVAGVAAGTYSSSQRPIPRPKLSYSRDILPILSDKCFNCHGPDSGSRKADLRLDTSQGAFASRDGLFPIVPSQPEHSLVVKRIRAGTMPPTSSGKTLTKSEIEMISQWIADGARYGKLWSFEPLPASVAVPEVHSTWPKNDIDRFILARLHQAKLNPSPAASRLRWLRRVTYDITGLPPTESEISAFQADLSAKAYEKVVDRLLASPHYGERMAVDWLDAARYSDSYGYQSDLISPTWPYRDWVIEAFNQNLPYDKFITYQLAGDLLPNPTRDQRLATAFNRLHRQSNEGGSIALEYKTEYAADRLSTYGTAMLGMTLNCARCHDHKFDPITQREYYQLFGYFNSIDEFGLLLSSEIVPTPSMLLPTPDQEKKLKELRVANDAAFAKLHKAEHEAIYGDARDQSKHLIPPYGDWLGFAPEKCRPLALNARFVLDQSTGTSYMNSVGGKATASSIGEVTLVPGPHAPRGQKAALLDGENGIVVHGLESRERWDPFTWSFWVQDPRNTTKQQILLHRTGGTDVGFCGFDLTIEDGYLTARVMRTWPGNAVAIRSKVPVRKNQWTHVAWSWDGSGRAAGLALFLNGQLVPSEVLNDRLWKKINAYGDLGPGGGDWSFGQRFRDLGFKGGKLADIAYADRDLSSLEIQDLFDGVALEQVNHFSTKPTQRQMAELEQYYRKNLDQGVQEAAKAFRRTQKDLANFEDQIYEISVMEDAPKEVPTYFLARGLYDAPRNEKTRVHRDVPKVLPPISASGKRIRNDRLTLAQWTVRRDNPLTARVTVNRYWQIFFGTGLVDSTENFGVQGSRPSHAELLDFLALKFMNSGWDVKKLVRDIVLSATYRQDSSQTPKLRQKDPDNRLLARGPSFRLSAEMIRDTALSASGLLVDQLGGPPVNPYQPAGLWTENNTMTPGFVQSKGSGLYRRSIYSTWKRTTPVPSILLFDATSREACSVKRPTTNTPVQALVLLNDVQYVEASRVLAQNVLQLRIDDATRINTVFRRLSGRDADTRERSLLLKDFEDQQAQFKADPASASKLIHMGDSKPPEAIPAPDLAAMTIVVQTVMNSDSVVWRR